MNPQVLKEYSGPGKENEQDILFLLRPKANNCIFESYLLSIFRASPEYRKTFWLEYLANMPGQKIVEDLLLDKHYEYRLFFAQQGKKAMNSSICKKFESFFKVNIDDCTIIGAYEALDRLKNTPQELFYNVYNKSNRDNKVRLEGQIFREHIDNDGKIIYVINPDIPNLLKLHNQDTNSAVFIFRTTLSYKEFNRLILEIINNISDTLEDPNSTMSKVCSKYLNDADIELLKGHDFFRHKRLFHYSHGPFEQILDARDFLYRGDGTHVPIEEITFAKYLIDQGISSSTISNLIRNPLIQIKTPRTIYEESLYVYSRNMNYQKGLELFKNIYSQRITKIDDFSFSDKITD